jgi:predicted enzyme related to lactoylglutathione lyase
MPGPKNGRFLIAIVAMALVSPPAAGAQVVERAPPEIGFSGLATFDIQVRDRSEAILWFSQVLGFEHLFTEESMNWAEVRSPVDNVTIGIEEIRDRPIRPSNIDFGVHDIDVARSAIEARGGVFVGETTDYGPVLIARLRDPSGNMFNLFQGK